MGLLIAGVVTVGLALLVLLLVAVIPREPTGVSRSLLLLEQRIWRQILDYRGDSAYWLSIANRQRGLTNCVR